MTRLRRLEAPLIWTATLALVTLVMYQTRGDTDQAHVALTYLLVVLGGSVSGGRLLGLALAFAGFLLIDLLFQLPYDTFTVGKSLDWVVLLVFLATAIAATELLAQARTEAEEARLRADEVASLARLGSETLNAPRADQALAAIAEVIRTTLKLSRCEIYQWSGSDLVVAAAAPAGTPGDAADLGRDGAALVAWAAAQGRAAVVRRDGAVVRAEQPATEVDAGALDTREARVVVLPLQAHSRTVGVLRIESDEPIVPDAARRRVLRALGYYAALGMERVLLVAEAGHAEALREADRMKDVVLASLSHDLRTPLTTIKVLAQDSARAGDANAPVIEEQADRLSRFVGDLLDLSRLKGGAFPVAPELNTAEDLLGAATRQVAGLLNGRTLTTRVDTSQPALLGRFDFVQSLRALANVLENALRYAPPGTAVELGVHRSDALLAFTVADRGPGVAEAERDRIFEPFYRAAGSPPDAGRTGLGLSIARRLAELQGGSLEYAPRAGGGSEFTLYLPAIDPVLTDSLRPDRIS